MQAIITKIQMVPDKVDDEGEVKQVATARVFIDVPLDADGQRDAVVELMGLLHGELVEVQVEPHQGRLLSAKQEGITV